MNSIRVILPLSENSAWMLDQFNANVDHEPFLLGVPDMLMDLDADSTAAQTSVTFFFVNTVLEPGPKAKRLNA